MGGGKDKKKEINKRFFILNIRSDNNSITIYSFYMI